MALGYGSLYLLYIGTIKINELALYNVSADFCSHFDCKMSHNVVREAPYDATSGLQIGVLFLFFGDSLFGNTFRELELIIKWK